MAYQGAVHTPQFSQREGYATGGRADAIAYTLIETAKLNDIDPQAWPAVTLACIPDHKITTATVSGKPRPFRVDSFTA